MQDPIATFLRAGWLSLPESVRSPCASEPELEAFELVHGRIPNEYRWFLAELGGGPVGSEWIDGIDKLARSHEKFRRESGARGWRNTEVFVIGWDGAGNPIGIDPSGRVVVEDHNFGGVHSLAGSFLEFLSQGLQNAL